MPGVRKSILITGGRGFIGKNILNSYNKKYQLYAPTHKELDLLIKDEVSLFFKNNKIDIVIHCANFGGNRKCGVCEGILEKNIRMFFNLLSNQDKYNKLITLGSGAEYDKLKEIKDISESEFGNKTPHDEYGFSKYLISKTIQSSEKMYCLRLFGVFGRYEDYEYKFISNAILKNLLHLPINIRQNVNFSWLYIQDFLRILEYFIEHDAKHAIYNLTPPNTTDLVTISEIINSTSDYKSDIQIVNGGLNLEYSGNNTQLLKEYPQITFTPMKTAIAELMEYYRSIIKEIDPSVIKKDEYADKCIIKV